MIKRLSSDSGQVLAYQLSGVITQEDVEFAQEDMKQALEQFGEVRMLLHLGDLETPEADAVWQDLKFTKVYMTQMERLAVVGDAAWQEWMTKAADLPSQGKMRFFEKDEVPQAWAWIEEGVVKVE